MNARRDEQRFLRAAVSAVAVLVALAGPAITSAQDEPESRAEALIREGLELRRAGQDADALARFTEAYEIEPTARGKAQIALAEQALGRWVEAYRHLEEALRSTEDPWIQAHGEFLRGELERIGEHVGHLNVECELDGATIWIDGAEVGTTPREEAIVLPSGSVLVELRAPGHQRERRELDVPGGGRLRERFALVPLASEPAPPLASEPALPPVASEEPLVEASPPPAQDDGVVIASVAIGGASVASLIVAAAAWVIREDHVARFNSGECISATQSRLERCGDSALTPGRQAEEIAIAFGAIAGATGLAAVIVGILAADAGGRPHAAVSCVPSFDASGTGAGVWCEGRL